jgi:hypothetical protein
MGNVLTDEATVEALADGAAVSSTGVYSAAATQTNNFTVQASIQQAHTGTKSIKVEKGTGNQTGQGIANTGAISIGSTWNELVVAFWYFPHTMTISSVNPNTVHTLVCVSTEWAICVDHNAGIQVKAQVIGASAAIQAVTSRSSALTNQQWHRIVAVYRRVDSTHTAVRLFVNNVEIGTEQTATHNPPSTLTAVRVGICTFGEPTGSIATVSSGSKLFIDDLNIWTVEPVGTGTKRIGWLISNSEDFIPGSDLELDEEMWG